MIALINVIFWSAMLCGVWALICNERTYRQRMWLIHNRPKEIFWEASEEWWQVDYDSHLWRLVTFRSPKKIYGSITRGYWK